MRDSNRHPYARFVQNKDRVHDTSHLVYTGDLLAGNVTCVQRQLLAINFFENYEIVQRVAAIGIAIPVTDIVLARQVQAPPQAVLSTEVL